MCVVSMIGEHYGEKFRQAPAVQPYLSPLGQPNPLQQPFFQAVSRQEFEEVKKEVAEMKVLLRRAKMYDEEHGEPACEIEEKMALLRSVAQLVGVDLDAEIGGK